MSQNGQANVKTFVAFPASLLKFPWPLFIEETKNIEPSSTLNWFNPKFVKKILSRWYPQWYIIWNNIKRIRVSNEKYDWKFWKLHYHNLWKALWIIYKYSLLSNFLITGHPKRRTSPLNFLYTGKTMVKSSHKTF